DLDRPERAEARLAAPRRRALDLLRDLRRRAAAHRATAHRQPLRRPPARPRLGQRRPDPARAGDAGARAAAAGRRAASGARLAPGQPAAATRLTAPGSVATVRSRTNEARPRARTAPPDGAHRALAENAGW